MDSDIQTSNYYYGLELMRSDQCPIDVNSKLGQDPRFLQQSPSLWSITEYDAQMQNGVLPDLMGRSGYYYPT